MSDSECRQIAEDAVELSVATSEDAQRVARFLRGQDTWREIVPGLASVTVLFDPECVGAAATSAALKEAVLRAPAIADAGEPVLELPVHYGGEFGPDLADVCAALEISEDSFIDRHTSAEHHVDMVGFTPGFAYMSGLDASLSVPRRAAPRPRLPAGSVGISGAYTGIYALSGPGGWPIVGRIEAVLFDPYAEDPFLLQPGRRVVFKAL